MLRAILTLSHITKDLVLITFFLVLCLVLIVPPPDEEVLTHIGVCNYNSVQKYIPFIERHPYWFPISAISFYITKENKTKLD